jgi:hypothetical protein
MTVPNTDLWELFDEMDRRRRKRRILHEQAFRQLDVAASSLRDAQSLQTWASYCDATRALDECVAEIESIVWKLMR